MTQVVSVPPSVAQPVRLGCGSPRAEIWTRGMGARVVELPAIVAADYGYMLSDTSLGEVTMDAAVVASDPRCTVLGLVRPWKHELVIYRDGVLAWSGPITRMEPGDTTFVIKARDLSAWLDHRVVHTTHIYGGQGPGQGSTDTTVIFAALVTDAMAPDPSPGLVLVSGLTSGVLSQGNYTPGSFKTIGPLIRDLAKGSIDWYCINRNLKYTGGGASAPPSGGAGATDVTATCFANPGFEVNTTGWGVAGTDWAITRDTAQFHAGVASGKLARTLGGAADASVTFTLTNLIVGKSYTLAGWARGSTANFQHQLFTMSVAGVTSTDIGYAAFKANPLVWLQANVNFIATATSHVLTIAATTGQNGLSTPPFWIDDFTLTLNNPDPPPTPPPPPVTPPTTFPLSDDDLIRPAKVTLDGLNQENRSLVSNQQAGGDVAYYGEAPAPAWALNTNGPGLTPDQTNYGLLEGSATSALADSAGAQSQASQRNILLSATPTILEGFVLSPNAKVAFGQLLPGALVAVRLDRPCLSVQQTLLIRQVQIKATPTSEEVTLILEPSGVD